MKAPDTFATTTVHQQTVYAESQPAYERKHVNVVRNLGIFEVILGVVSLACGIATLAILKGVGTYGTGIWGGIWFILSGAFGIAAGSKNTTSCMINTHMALSIIAAVVAAVQVIWTALQAVAAYYVVYSVERGRVSPILFSLYGIFTALSVVSGISMVVHIVSASFCCCALPSCCRGGAVQPSHVLVTQGPVQTFPGNQGMQTLQYPGGDYPPPGYAPL